MQKPANKIRALLLGSSPYHAKRDFFPSEAKAFQEIFGACHKTLFIPFALRDHAAYAAFNTKLFAQYGQNLVTIKSGACSTEMQTAIEQADSFFIGGGNTFRLLAALHRFDIFQLLRTKILNGAPYLGTSAGSTLFCPTIQTTNDMPIVPTPDMRAFDFLPYQINPHFPEKETQGAAESRRDRLNEFHEENTTPIVALREGGFLLLKDSEMSLGDKPAVLFRQSQPSIEINDLSALFAS